MIPAFGRTATAVGVVLTIAGLAMEFVATIAMNSGWLRNKLPIASPFSLMVVGQMCFFVGVLVILVGQWSSR
jgi:hypothetical protein